MGKSSERNGMRWQGFRRAEAAMYHASKIYQGSHDIAATLKAARLINKYFGDAAEQAARDAESFIPRDAHDEEGKT
jgi:hypothetical protein